MSNSNLIAKSMANSMEKIRCHAKLSLLKELCDRGFISSDDLNSLTNEVKANSFDCINEIDKNLG
jgi:hypothetical protein